MNPLEQILAQINAQRAALTGGTLAPDETNPAGATAATGDETGGALAPDAVAEQDKLQKALRLLKQNRGGKPWKALEAFGGQVLGYGQHQDADPGHTGRFADVLRSGKLFHVYRDGTKQKIDTGAVAEALGIRPKRAELTPVPDARMSMSTVQNGTGGAQAPAVPRLPGLEELTGGVSAESAATPRGQDPLEELRRLLHARA